MNAVVISSYGGPEVLQVRDVPTPKPNEHEVLIRIHAAAVNSTDPVFRKGKPLISRLFTGLLKPRHRIPGDVLAGEIVEIGSAVTRFRIGDRVYGYSSDRLGAHAEYTCLPEDAPIVEIPDGISYETAAGIVDGGLTALVFLRDKGRIRDKQRVLVYGASGSVGTAAVQIAVHYGAEVTGVCSTANVDMVRSLGATHVIDYAEKDVTRDGDTYDIIFDTVAKSSFLKCRNILTEDGIYMATFPSACIVVRGLFQPKDRGKRAYFVAAGLRPAKEKIDNLHFLSGLLTDKVITTVIDRTYSLNTIAEAHRYVEAGHKKGNVILRVIGA